MRTLLLELRPQIQEDHIETWSNVAVDIRRERWDHGANVLLIAGTVLYSGDILLRANGSLQKCQTRDN